MDLFNPPKLYNYNIMIKDVDFSKFENPPVQVVWEDYQENFTQDKIKSVKHYFQKKYNTTNVNVLTKAKIVDQETNQTIDISVNITDTNYQLDLLKNFLTSKGYDKKMDEILDLNKSVEGRMDNIDTSQFKQWYIRNIEFSNFLSYGENQKLDIDKLNGIVVVESDPKNFGGKCLRPRTEIEIEYDVDSIVEKLGFLPDELKSTNKKITLKECYDIFKKYGDLDLKVNTPYGYKKINGCEITEKDGEVLKIVTETGLILEGSYNHRVKAKNGKFVELKKLKLNDIIKTITGNEKVVTIVNEGVIEDLYDIEVDEVRQYYSNGVVSHNSVLSVDLPMFLFFNETTKTTKAEEIFNRFTDKDKVLVKGEITIDGEDYIIARTIERKKSKKGDWNVKTELDFFKKLADGSLLNFTGEQRRETEDFIKNSIGTKEDFLMTILTTATNLEDLLESKPTARGQILSRFMGLEFLKRKEEVAKEIYSEFNKSKLSNIYNSEKLKNDIETYREEISDLNDKIVTYEGELKTIEEGIIKGKQYRDDMLNKKHSDIDREIAIMNPDDVKSQIQKLTTEKSSFQTKLNELNVVEPENFYHEDEHDKVKDEYNKVNTEKIKLETRIYEIEKLKSSVKGGIKCEHCGIELMNAAITQQKIAELDGLTQQKDEKIKLITDLINKEKQFVETKRQFDEYEKNKLIKEKYELSIESCDLKIVGLNTKLEKWEEVQDKIQGNKKVDEMLIKADMRLEELERTKRTKTNEISTAEYNIKSKNEKIVYNENMIVKIGEEEQKDSIYKMYLEAFGKNGLSKIIMKTMMPLINSELQRLMEDSSNFKLEIRINDKNEVEFIMVDNSTGIEKLMISGSGYEKTIASLALRSVLSKICSLPKPNIIVMDEVFGKIANDNLELVAEFFTKIKTYFDKIFVISHNPLINQWADTTIRVTKEDNVSRILS